MEGGEWMVKIGGCGQVEAMQSNGQAGMFEAQASFLPALLNARNRRPFPVATILVRNWAAI
jgi:hypothetical protein